MVDADSINEPFCPCLGVVSSQSSTFLLDELEGDAFEAQRRVGLLDPALGLGCDILGVCDLTLDGCDGLGKDYVGVIAVIDCLEIGGCEPVFNND